MYGDVILIRDVIEGDIRAGDVGTVVERHVVPGVAEEGYSVEFFDMTGNTVALVTLPASALRLPTPTDRPAVRALSASTSKASRKPRVESWLTRCYRTYATPSDFFDEIHSSRSPPPRLWH
jgi:hypothetical protein